MSIKYTLGFFINNIFPCAIQFSRTKRKCPDSWNNVWTEWMLRYNRGRKMFVIISRSYLFLLLYGNHNDSKCVDKIAGNQWLWNLHSSYSVSIFRWSDLRSDDSGSRVKDTPKTAGSKSWAELVHFLYYFCLYSSNCKNEWTISSFNIYTMRIYLFDSYVLSWTF